AARLGLWKEALPRPVRWERAPLSVDVKQSAPPGTPRSSSFRGSARLQRPAVRSGVLELPVQIDVAARIGPRPGEVRQLWPAPATNHELLVATGLRRPQRHAER